MKILMVLDNKFPTDLRVENEATSLIKAGHRVGLLSIADYKESKITDYKGITVYKVAISKFKRNKMRGLAAMIPWIDRYVAKKILQLIQLEKYDAVHFHDLYLFGAAKILKKKSDLLLIGDLHENYVDVLQDYNWSTKFPNRLLISIPKWRRKEKEWLQLLDKVIVVSSGMGKRTTAKGVNKNDIILVPNTLKTSVFDNYEIDESIINRFKDHFMLLYIGGFISNRGLEHVIEGMEIIKNYSKKIRLLLVGDGSSRADLEKLAKQKGVQDFVDFEGWQPQEKIKSYLMASDVGLVPFKRTPQTDNSSSNKLFQYMYYGKPILGTDCTSVKELVEKESCGIIYEAENSEQFVRATKKLFENKLYREELSTNGIKAIKEKYNWDLTVKDMINMYNSLDNKMYKKQGIPGGPPQSTT